MDLDRRRTLAAAAHPIVLGAAALVLLNDFVLRGRAPGWLTGKLADVGWLVVAPVLVAAVAAGLGVAGRWARAGGLVVAAGFYTALQLWPPLGAALHGGHVADLGDLLALPALFGAVVAWRRAGAWPRAGVLTLPVLGGVLLADDWGVTVPFSLPCGEGMTWDAAVPLQFTVGWFEDTDSDAFAKGIRLTVAATGEEVPTVVAPSGDTVFVCAREGLRADTDYVWEIGPWDEAQSNELSVEFEGLPTVRFRTGAAAGPAVTTWAGCVSNAGKFDAALLGACQGGGSGDTGDAGDTGDSGDTDTGDSADTGDSGDSGDSGTPA